MARVNILRQVRTDKGWRNAALPRKKDGRINWPANGRYLIDGARTVAAAKPQAQLPPRQ